MDQTGLFMSLALFLGRAGLEDKMYGPDQAEIVRPLQVYTT